VSGVREAEACIGSEHQQGWGTMTHSSERSITLREVSPADLSVFFEHQQDAEANHMAAFTRGDPSDREAFDAHWQRVLDIDTVVVRAILRGGDVAGHIAKFERDGEAEVTYWLGRRHWGRGVATAALRQFLREYTPRPLFARVARDNVASVRVLEKCGFVAERVELGYAHARGREIEESVLRLA
jgi:RimJ/RimL family protein N-acetyltransferase